MLDENNLSAILSALNAVICALIESHPDRPKLAILLDKAAEDTPGYLLHSDISDEALEKTKSTIQMYRRLASPLPSPTGR